MALTQRQAVRRFQRQVDRFARSLPSELFPRFIRAVTLEVLRGVVLKTRVDTGRARGNWQVSIGSPPTGETAPDKTGGRAISQGMTSLANYRGFESVYVGNNVPYIRFLNDGTERFRGDKMVERTLAEVETIFP